MREGEFKINAKGLSLRGPRMMVESELSKEKCRWLRVIVSDLGAVDDLREYFTSMGAADIEVDRVGEDYHVVVELGVEANDKT